MCLVLGALFDLYFQQADNPSDHQQLLSVVESIGLVVSSAQDLLNTELYSQEVRALQQHYQAAGVSSVSAVIVNN